MNGHTDQQLLIDSHAAIDLLHLLGFLDEVLRHGGHELREDIADRYTPTTLLHLLDELDTQSALLRRVVHLWKGSPAP